MNICYFGNFDPEYERNRVIISGLRQNGATVILCDGWRQWFRLSIPIDLVIVGYSDRQFSVFLARLLFRCPVVWDAFYSLYDSYVFDRKLVSPRSLKACYYWAVDWLRCAVASRILLDTDAHIGYFTRTFHIARKKFIRSLVGASDDIFRPVTAPAPESHSGFRVLFFGNFSPLQGALHIIRAAKLLDDSKDISFDIIGSGQTYQQVRALADQLQVRNITFRSWQTVHELASSIAHADLCLGIFGETGKAQRVIPNKVYEAVAMGKAVITSDTPAIRELFTDRRDILLCRPADPQDLAEKIRSLRDDETSRLHIASGGYKTYRAHCTPSVVGAMLLNQLTLLAYRPTQGVT